MLGSTPAEVNANFAVNVNQFLNTPQGVARLANWTPGQLAILAQTYCQSTASCATPALYSLIAARDMVQAQRFALVMHATPSPQLDMTIQEIFEEYYLAPDIEVSVASAAYSTLLYAGTALASSYYGGYKFGQFILWVENTFAPDLAEADAEALADAIDAVMGVLTTIQITTSYNTLGSLE
jgi:hypothetical protein